MSEAKSFMQQLDAWTHQTIIEPMLQAVESQDTTDWNRVRDGVYKAIREKVLDSYHNGLKAAGQKPPVRKEWRRNAQAQTR